MLTCSREPYILRAGGGGGDAAAAGEAGEAVFAGEMTESRRMIQSSHRSE